MNPGQQLHRSLTLWAGLITILFTAWMWWDSCTQVTIIQWKQFWTGNVLRGFYILRVPHSDNELLFQRVPWVPSATQDYHKLFQPPFLAHSEAKEGDTPLFPPSGTLQQNQQASVNRRGPGSWCLYIPYWLILPPILLTWTALLIFRARRRQRAITLPPNEGTS